MSTLDSGKHFRGRWPALTTLRSAGHFVSASLPTGLAIARTGALSAWAVAGRPLLQVLRAGQCFAHTSRVGLPCLENQRLAIARFDLAGLALAASPQLGGTRAWPRVAATRCWQSAVFHPRTSQTGMTSRAGQRLSGFGLLSLMIGQLIFPLDR